MVALPGIRAFAFHTDLDRIRDAFRASMSAIDERRRQAVEAHQLYMDSGEDDSEYDQDGVLVSSTRHALQWAELDASLAPIVVRQAFVTSAFHYWERSARAWTGFHGNGFPSLRERVEALGYAVSEELDLLNTLNNLLKHDNPEKGRKVFDKRSSLFLGGREPAGGSWQSALRITDDDVEHFFDIVRASGPAAAT